VFLFFYFLFLSDQIQRLNFYVLITKEKNTYAVLIKIFFFHETNKSHSKTNI